MLHWFWPFFFEFYTNFWFRNKLTHNGFWKLKLQRRSMRINILFEISTMVDVSLFLQFLIEFCSQNFIESPLLLRNQAAKCTQDLIQDKTFKCFNAILPHSQRIAQTWAGALSADNNKNVNSCYIFLGCHMLAEYYSFWPTNNKCEQAGWFF